MTDTIHHTTTRDASGFNPTMDAPGNPVDAKHRSPLRDGTALDDLRPDRPLINSLLDRSELTPVLPPLEGTEPFEKFARICNQLHKQTQLINRAQPLDLSYHLANGVKQYIEVKGGGTASLTRVKFRPNDPIDPVVIYMEAVPLVRTVLLYDPEGIDGLDLDGIAYIIERLEQAKQLRVHQSDIRFDVLEALSRLLSTLLAKAHAEVLA